jgi:hypothetical protein
VERGKPGAGIARVLRTFAVLDLDLVAEDGHSDSPAGTSRHSTSAAAITRLVSRAGRGSR